MDKQYQIDETKRIVFGRAGYRCEAILHNGPCNRLFSHPSASPQLAHIVKKSKANLKKYGDRIINHPLNLKAVCSLAHNSTVDLGHNQHAIDKHIDKIKRAIEEGE